MPTKKKSKKQQEGSSASDGIEKTPKKNLQVAFALVALAVLGIYGQTIHFKFIWDDVQINICENPYIKEFKWENLVRFWTKDYGKLYIPLIYTVWMGLAQISQLIFPDFRDSDIFNQTGLMPGVFHAANILVKIINGCLCVILLRRFVRRFWLAVAGGLLFVLHPLSVEPTSWVTGMKDLLSGMLFFLCLYFFMRFREEKEGNSDRWYWSMVGAFVLALTAKPSAVITPLVIIGVDRFLYNRRWIESIKDFGAWIIAGGLWTILIKGMQPMHETTVKIPGWADRLWIALDALGFYWTKFFYPFPIIIDYGRTPHWLMAQEWWIAGGLITLMAMVGIALWQVSRPYFWLVAMVAISVLPTSGLVPFEYQFRYSTVADRYAYLALFWMIALVIILIERLSESIEVKRQSLAWIPAPFLALIILGCATYSYALTSRWQNGVILYGTDVLKNPGSKHLNNNFATSIASRHPNRDLELARVYAARAVEIDPHFFEGLYTLGDVYFFMSKYDEAIPYLRRSLVSRPDLDLPLNKLLDALFKAKRYEEAFDAINYAMTKRNINLPADKFWQSVIQSALNRRDSEAALAAAKKAIAASPNNLDFQVTAATLATFLERSDDDVDVKRGLDLINSNNLQAIITHGKLLGTLGQPHKALEQFEKALSISPDNLDILPLVALAKKEIGDIPGATEIARKAIQIAQQRGRNDIVQDAGRFLNELTTLAPTLKK
jgi:tetratricopeptide (TPR) repeat protein